MDWLLKAMLLICLWREARGEGLEGMRACGRVIRNRVLAWKKDWDEVIAGRFQFSSMTVAGDSQLVVWPDDDAPAVKQLGAVVEAIFSGADHDPTNGALYYANIKLKDSPSFSKWFRQEIIEKPEEHPVRATIGQHVFYA